MTGGTGRPSPTPRSTPRAPRLEGEAHRPRHARPDTGETPVRRRAGQDWPPPRTGPVAVPQMAREAPPTTAPQARPPMRETEDPSSLSNFAVSHLRTYVPVLWGGIVSFLVTRWPEADGLLQSSGLTVAGPVALTALATAAWYTLWRWLEPHVPDALTAILLGHAQPPTYPDRPYWR